MRQRGIVLVVAALAAALATAPAGAQQACTYRACGLGIAPTWNGLALVRGASSDRVANLNFFLPRDVAPAFAGARDDVRDSVAHHARRAIRLRRAGALLTDVGLALGGWAAVRAASEGRLRASDRRLALVGAASVGASVPLQFAADGALSRAVWWYNARFAP